MLLTILLIDNKDSKKRYRAYVLLEDHMEKINKKIIKEITKAQKRFGEKFDESEFRKTNPNVLRNQGKINDIEASMKKSLEEMTSKHCETLLLT